jgi:uncharacterized protein YndB with AHSA1/START domain
MTSFAYTTYIQTTAKTKRWWNVAYQCDWKAGSTYAIKQSGVTIADPEQVVLESDPQKRLSYTWHTFTPEWAKVHGFSDEFLAKVTGEPRSKVTFTIEPLGKVVRLTVTHDGFKAGSAVLKSVKDGWPPLLSSLKTMLETGEQLPL